jgi:2-polyprenyl-6-methoxyphenol hydroxylase-like FAD-dependent oxidoreductase
MATDTTPVLIIGAGITGLALAQACRRESVPYRIFEKDESAIASGNTWAAPLNWTAGVLSSLLPDDIATQIPGTYVNKSAVEAGQRPQFKCFDLGTAQAKSQKPSTERVFVNGSRLARLLSTNLNIEYGKQAQSLTVDAAGSVTVAFVDGTSASGKFLVGCDGIHSDIRRILHPNEYKNIELPARAISATVQFSEVQIADIRALDQYFLYGIDQRNDTFLRFSLVEGPNDVSVEDARQDKANNSTYYRCEIVIAWPYRPDFLGRVEPTKVPNTDIGQFSMMQTIAENWIEPFRSLVMNINLNEAEIKPIEIADWICPEPSQEAPAINVSPLDGHVALAGDAAHTIAMYSGEAGDHAIMDVKHLVPLLRAVRSDDAGSFTEAAQAYERGMLQRSILAVLASRQACMDVHQIQQ